MSDMRDARTRRRVLATGAAATVPASLAVLAGCGEGRRTAAPAGTPVRQAVTLEYWSRWGAPASEVEDKRAAEWMAANAPTKLERVTMPSDYIEKLTAAFAAASGPDVYMVGGSGVPNFVAKGATLNLSANGTVQRELPDFFVPLVEATTYQGKLHGLPYAIDVRAMVYRKDAMRESGLDPASFPETWEAFRDAARRMTKRDDGAIARAGYALPKTRWEAHDLFMVLHEQQGERPFSADLAKPSFSGPAGRQALQLLVELVNRDQVDDYSAAGSTNANGVITGTSASVWTSAGPVNMARRQGPDTVAQLATAPIPRLKQRVTFMGGNNLIVSGKPKDAPAAVDFMIYLTAAKHADEINSVRNNVPPRKSAAAGPYVSDPLIKTFYDAQAHGWTYPNHAYYTEIRDLIDAELIAALKQTKGVPAALEDASRGAQEYLARK